MKKTSSCRCPVHCRAVELEPLKVPSNANNSMILLLRFLADFKTLIDLYVVSKFFYNYKEVVLHKVKLSKTLHIDLAS